MNDALRAKIHAMMPGARDELAELVAIKSVADPRQFPPEECRRAAEWVAARFTDAGLSGVGLHPTPDGSAAVVGARPAPPGAPTVLLYCHYDVQPPLGDDQWRTPPFTLTERDGRWYGRVVHSGMFGRPAPDALAALVHMLATLRDAAGDTTITGLEAGQTWPGVDYPADRFRADATVLDGVGLLGRGSVADTLWARPAVTVLGIDGPPVVGSSAAIQPSVRARLNLRIPPGVTAADGMRLLTGHLQAAAPWHARVSVEPEQSGEPFRARTDGPAYAAMSRAMKEAYGTAPVTEGQGESIPLCNVFAETYPDAEIILMGVEEPKCLIHAPNESVDPSEIEHQALTEALFLSSFTTTTG